MRQNSALGMIIAIVVLVAALAGGYVYLTKQQTNQPGGDPSSLQPTDMPIPNVKVLEAATDIEANKLMTSDLEQYFNVVEVQPSEVLPDDVLETEFFSAVQGKVTIANIRGGDRIKKSAFRNAGIAEKLPTPAPGQESPKAYNMFVTDIGGIVAEGNRVDILGSYSIEQPYLRFTGIDKDGVITLIDEKFMDITTHVLAQNVPVLKVIAPPLVTTDGQQTGGAPPPAEPTIEVVVDGSPVDAQPTPETVFTQGAEWQIVVGLTAQQAEFLEYTKARTGSTLSIVVRRADDQEQVTTTGVTMDLLMRLYGVPQVYAQPNMIVKLLDAPAPPQPPQQPAVVIPFALPNAPQQQPLPSAVPTQTP